MQKYLVPPVLVKEFLSSKSLLQRNEENPSGSASYIEHYICEVEKGKQIKFIGSNTLNYDFSDAELVELSDALKSQQIMFKASTILVNDVITDDIAKIITAARDNNIGISFDIAQSKHYEQVYLVGKFSSNELTQFNTHRENNATYIMTEEIKLLNPDEIQSIMQNAGIEIKVIRDGIKGKDLTACLENLFQGVEDSNISLAKP